MIDMTDCYWLTERKKSLFFAAVNVDKTLDLPPHFLFFLFLERITSSTLTFIRLPPINSVGGCFCFPSNPLLASEGLLMADDVSSESTVAARHRDKQRACDESPRETSSLWHFAIFTCLFFFVVSTHVVALDFGFVLLPRMTSTSTPTLPEMDDWFLSGAPIGTFFSPNQIMRKQSAPY